MKKQFIASGMDRPEKKEKSRKRQLGIFIMTIIAGLLLFIIPDLFFGITKLNGGKIGVNLLYIALFQFVTISGLLFFSLKSLGKDLKYIGLVSKRSGRDILLGLVAGLLWTTLQIFIIPATGGAERADISGILNMYDGSVPGLLSFIALGVIGGGITEELFNRGYFINVLKDTFENPKAGLWISAFLSVVLFALGHLPANALEWFDILVPTLLYTSLFLFTRRLTASMVAHGAYNASMILWVYYTYYH